VLWALATTKSSSRAVERQHMNPSPITVSSRKRRKEDLVYQVVTVAAMVTMLASVWIF